MVYHLFGMDCPDPDGNDREEFAVTEEELLEYVVHAEQPNRQPGILFEILHRNRLLVLGTSYPECQLIALQSWQILRRSTDHGQFGSAQSG